MSKRQSKKQSEEIRNIPAGTKVVWQPQPKQAEMMSRPEHEALYGGAAGGGKTDYLVVEALRQVDIPYYKGLILRRTVPQLKEIIDKAYNIYPKAYPGVTYNQTTHRWTFPSGAKIDLGSLKDEASKYNYQGIAYDFIGFDELTHFTQSQYEYLKSRNRPNGPGTRVYMRATANPGGVGHGWVKTYFIDEAPYGEPYIDVVKVNTPTGIEYKATSRVYIPASVFDNRHLMENDPEYVTRLASLPEAERDALLYGNWESFQGQCFREWRNDPHGYESQQWTHVIKPFRIPDDWVVWRSYDFGYAKPFSVAWTAISHDNVMYRFKEYYGCTGTANTGLCMEPHEQARRIKEIELADPVLHDRAVNGEILGVADNAIWDESRGQSIADMMEEEGIFFTPSKKDRLTGKMQCHYRLAFDENGRSMFYVFDTCKEFIRTVPALVYSEKHVEDIDTTQEDHVYDEWRYLCMENPINPRVNMAIEVPEYDYLHDPLNQYHDRYGEPTVKVQRTLRI